MRRLVFLVTLSLVAMLVLAPAALAQTDLYDCGDFTTQEEAQQFLLAGDPYGLDDDNDGTACDNLPSGGTGGGTTQQPTTPTQYVQPETPTQGDLDCADFASQAEAQATFDADPSDPNGLDADDDGIACETLAGGGTVEDGTVMGGGTTTATQQPAAQTPEATQTTTTALPTTGGPSLLLPVAGLLVLGAGLLVSGFARRSR